MTNNLPILIISIAITREMRFYSFLLEDRKHALTAVTITIWDSLCSTSITYLNKQKYKNIVSKRLQIDKPNFYLHKTCKSSYQKLKCLLAFSECVVKGFFTHKFLYFSLHKRIHTHFIQLISKSTVDHVESLTINSCLL